MLNYFAIVKINSHGMLHFHYLIRLKNVLHLGTLQSQIQNNVEFSQKLLLFLEHIIKCLACKDPHTETLDRGRPNANNSITTLKFADLLKANSKAVVQKVQMHLLFDKPTYYKYNIYKSKVCRFDFLRPIIPNSEIDSNRTIWLR